jgi:hypothetical protein
MSRLLAYLHAVFEGREERSTLEPALVVAGLEGVQPISLLDRGRASLPKAYKVADVDGSLHVAAIRVDVATPWGFVAGNRTDSKEKEPDAYG